MMNMNNIQYIFEHIKIIDIWRDKHHLRLLCSFNHQVLIFYLIIALLGMILIITPRKLLLGSKIVFNITGFDPGDVKFYNINFEYVFNIINAEIIDDFVESTEQYLIKEKIPFEIVEIRNISVKIFLK
jgi:hypothetical protein